MALEIQYPTSEKVIEYNPLALTIIKVKKADKLKVLSNHAIFGIDCNLVWAAIKT